jgi:carbonic anhydrase
MTPDEALEQLRRGNRRFAENRLDHPHQTPGRRIEVAGGQHPFAQILTCSDSRVVPEVLFDTGIGDLFVVRVAGNIVDDAVIGTLEYGAAHLKVPLTVVLGHTCCGAVTAAAAGEQTGDHIETLMGLLRPVVEAARGMPGDLVENTVRTNVRNEVTTLRRSRPTLFKLWSEGAIGIIGGVYDISTGRVEWLDPDTRPSGTQSA